jgi:mannose-6-phosphate isomerase
MKFTFTNIDEIKTIKKPWGHEKWISSGAPNFNYALKEIFFRAPHRTSLQFHKIKEETEYFQKGEGFFHYSTEIIDIKKFENGEYSEEDIKKIVNNLEKMELKPGSVIHVKPGCIHRVEATEDMTMLEASTIQLDDVIRLSDDNGRPDGKITSEHL